MHEATEALTDVQEANTCQCFVDEGHEREASQTTHLHESHALVCAFVEGGDGQAQQRRATTWRELQGAPKGHLSHLEFPIPEQALRQAQPDLWWAIWVLLQSLHVAHHRCHARKDALKEALQKKATAAISNFPFLSRH